MQNLFLLQSPSPILFLQIPVGGRSDFFSLSFLCLHPSICPGDDVFFPFLTKKGVVIIFQKLVTFLRSDRTIYIGTAADGKKWHKNRACKRKKNHSMREKKIRRNNTNNKKPKRGEEYDAKGTKDIGGMGGGE